MKKKNRNEPELTEQDKAEIRAALSQVGFDPASQHLDLSKEEKLRTTALMLAGNYVRDTICNDAQMYQALKADGKKLIPATVPLVIQVAVSFEAFIKGKYSNSAPARSSDELPDSSGNVSGIEEPTESPAAPDTGDPQ